MIRRFNKEERTHNSRGGALIIVTGVLYHRHDCLVASVA
jgi:hypothetical protein